MAGYMTKLQGYVYEGELTNGASDAVKNGILMVQNGDKLELPSAESTSKFICKEVTTIYDGVVAYRFLVDKLNKRYYLVENGSEYFNDQAEYDNREHAVPVGELLRAHPLLVGEEFVTDMVTGTPAAGTAYGVQADGTIG
jgi:hypothetical protein